MISKMQIASALDLESLKKFVQGRVLPGARERDERNRFPLELLEEVASMGYTQAFVPEEMGGMGLPTADLIEISRAIAYGSPGISTSLAGNTFAAVLILKYGQAALRHAVAKKVLGGLSLASICFTEPKSGSDIFSIETKAEKVRGGYVISGQKCFITNATYADHYVVIAKLVGFPGKTPHTAFYVPRGAAGLSVGKPLEKLGHRDSDTNEVYLNQVFVPDEHLLGEEGGGMPIFFTALQRSRTLIAASAVGLCDRVRDVAVDFLRNREHYGKSLIAQPAIRNLLAQQETERQAAWYLTCASAAHWDAGDFNLHPSSMAKMFSGQVTMEFASRVLELFGGWGYTREFEIERLYRDAKLYEIIEGPSFVQQVIIAKELFPEPKSAVRPLRKVA